MSFPKSLKLLCFWYLIERSLQNVFLLPAALTRWNRWKNAFRTCAKTISIGNIPDSRRSGRTGRHRGRPRGQPRGRDRRAGSGAGWPGGIGGSNRKIEPEDRTGRGPAVKPNGAQDGAQGGTKDGRPAAAGRNAKEAERSRAVPRLFFRLLLFGGRRPAARRFGRTSGGDRPYIGDRKPFVKEIKRKFPEKITSIGSDALVRARRHCRPSAAATTRPSGTRRRTGRTAGPRGWPRPPATGPGACRPPRIPWDRR